MFSIEEGIFEQKAYYRILSFVVLILIDLNIIEKRIKIFSCITLMVMLKYKCQLELTLWPVGEVV